MGEKYTEAEQRMTFELSQEQELHLRMIVYNGREKEVFKTSAKNVGIQRYIIER